MENQIIPRELLRHAKVFSHLDDDWIALLEERMTRLGCSPGDFICREGESDDRMFLIADGEVDVLKKGDGGCDVEVATLQRGDVAGEMSVFSEGVRSASLRAKGPVQVWALDKERFRMALESNPQMARNLLAELSNRLRRETYIVAQLLSGDLDNRTKVAVFDSKPYIRQCFEVCNTDNLALHFFEPRLSIETVTLASGFDVVCAFVNDHLDAPVIEELGQRGVKMIALRCAGYNNVDLEAARRAGISVARVPAYSPYAVAEHAAALLLTLNRKTHRAYNRVREGNFSLNHLVGVDLHGRTAGIVGVGKIGKCLANILAGFGMRLLGHDQYQDTEFAESVGLKYVELDELLQSSDLVSLHAPLLPETRHMIDAAALDRMKQGAILINTSRGALVDTQALIDAMKSGKIGAAGLDVYEEEEAYFFEDRSSGIISDDQLARLMTFNNVLITSHQAFLTHEALNNIADTTFGNIREFMDGKRMSELTHGLCPQPA